MDQYKHFDRVSVFGATIDIVTMLESPGLIPIEKGSQFERLHAGAHAVAFVSSSLSRDVSIALTNPDLSIESTLAALRILSEIGYISGADNALDLELSGENMKGLVIGERSSSVRIQVASREHSEVIFSGHTVSDADMNGHFLIGDKKVSLFSKGRAENTAEELPAIIFKGRDRLAVVSADVVFPMSVVLPMLRVGMESEIFYHTLVLEFESQEFSIVYQQTEQKFWISCSPLCLFRAQLTGPEKK